MTVRMEHNDREDKAQKQRGQTHQQRGARMTTVRTKHDEREEPE